MEKLSRGLRNNNPFNIKKSHIKFVGEIDSTDKVFKQFSTRVYGIRAGLVILHTYMTVYNIHTISSIIERFAPSSENATVFYWSYISRNMRVDPFQHIDCNVANLASLGYWICQYENGNSCPLSLNDFIDCIHSFKLL